MDATRDWRFAAWAEGMALRYPRSLAVLILVGYLLCFNGLWRVQADSALYLQVAVNLASGEGYTYLGQSERLAYPGLPYLLSWLIRLSPHHYIALADAIILAMGLGAIALCYPLFRLMVRPGTALVAVTLTSMNSVLYQYCFEILTDIPFLLGTVMTLLGGALCGAFPAPRIHPEAMTPTRRQRGLGWVLLPAGFALCAVMRPTFYLLAGCAVVAAVLGILQRVRAAREAHRLAAGQPPAAEWPRRRVVAVLGGLVLVAGLSVLVIVLDPRRHDAAELDVYEEAVLGNLQRALADPMQTVRWAWQVISPEFPTAFFGISWSPYLDPVMVLLVLGVAAWHLRRYPMALLWIAATLGVQFIVDPVPRYMIPIIPLLCLAWWLTALGAGRLNNGLLANLLAIGMTVIYLINPVHSTGIVWTEQYRRPFSVHFRNGQYAHVYEMARILQAQTPEDALIILPAKDPEGRTLKLGRILTYLGKRWVAYPTTALPPEARLRPLYVLSYEHAYPRRELRELVRRGRSLARTTALGKDGRALLLHKAQWRDARPQSRPSSVPAAALPATIPATAPATDAGKATQE